MEVDYYVGLLTWCVDGFWCDEYYSNVDCIIVTVTESSSKTVNSTETIYTDVLVEYEDGSTENLSELRVPNSSSTSTCGFSGRQISRTP